MTPDERERLFLDKVFQNVADPGFEATVDNYLRTMVDDWTAQAERTTGITKLECKAKAAAYADALRVLDDAVQAALDYSNPLRRR